jgi:hypothetical protein
VQYDLKSASLMRSASSGRISREGEGASPPPLPLRNWEGFLLEGGGAVTASEAGVSSPSKGQSSCRPEGRGGEAG